MRGSANLKHLLLLVAFAAGLFGCAASFRNIYLEHPKWTYLDRGHEAEVKERVAHWWDHRRSR
jgi:hypothetical protein